MAVYQMRWAQRGAFQEQLNMVTIWWQQKLPRHVLAPEILHSLIKSLLMHLIICKAERNVSSSQESRVIQYWDFLNKFSFNDKNVWFFFFFFRHHKHNSLSAISEYCTVASTANHHQYLRMCSTTRGASMTKLQ